MLELTDVEPRQRGVVDPRLPYRFEWPGMFMAKRHVARELDISTDQVNLLIKRGELEVVEFSEQVNQIPTESFIDYVVRKIEETRQKRGSDV